MKFPPSPHWSLLCFSKVMSIVVVPHLNNTLEGVFMMLSRCATFSLVSVWVYPSQHEAVLVGADKSSNCGSHFHPIWLPPSTGLTSSRITGRSYLIQGPFWDDCSISRQRYCVIYKLSYFNSLPLNAGHVMCVDVTSPVTVCFCKQHVWTKPDFLASPSWHSI